MVSVLCISTSSTVFRALGEHEVVAIHFLRGLQLAVDPAVALLDAAGVPGQVEVEEIRAVGLEVQALGRHRWR